MIFKGYLRVQRISSFMLKNKTSDVTNQTTLKTAIHKRVQNSD